MPETNFMIVDKDDYGAIYKIPLWGILLNNGKYFTLWPSSVRFSCRKRYKIAIPESRIV